MTDERRRWTAPQIMAAIAVVLAVGGALWLLLWPCAYQGITAVMTVDGAEVSRTTICRSFLEANEVGTGAIFAFPVAFAVLGLVAARTGRWGIFIGAAVALLLFCFLGTLSVGLWFLPSAIVMLLAVGWTARPKRPSRAR